MKKIWQNIFIIIVIGSVLAGCNNIVSQTPIAKPPTPPEDMETALKILFIGNSLTYVNDLPGMFRELSHVAGKEFFVDEKTIGGAKLELLSENQGVLNKIREKKWDYIILQSDDITAFPDMYHIEIATLNRFKNIIYANNPTTRILYFMVWGLQDGVTLREVNGEMVYYSYWKYMEKIYTGTVHIAKETELQIAPVGWVWYELLKNKPETILFAADKAHPALRGSYIGACVFYAVIFGESAEGLAYYSDIPAAEATYLQALSSVTVLDNLELWQIRSQT